MRNNRIQLSILLYLIFIIIFIYFKPQFIYNNDGTLKHFGTGEDATIIPLWLIILLLAFFSYYIAQIIIFKTQ